MFGFTWLLYDHNKDILKGNPKNDFKLVHDGENEKCPTSSICDEIFTGLVRRAD